MKGKRQITKKIGNYTSGFWSTKKKMKIRERHDPSNLFVCECGPLEFLTKKL